MIQLANLINHSITSIELTAIIDTALCVGAGGSSGSLADKPIIRNAEGKLMIPASQLKGRLRHECEKIARGLKWPVCQSPKAATMCPQRAGIEDELEFHRDEYKHNNRYHCIICQLFGNPSLPSRLIFQDLICQESPENLPSEIIRPGATINRRRRVAEDKKLYYLETSPMNAELQFTGSIQILPQRINFTNTLHEDYAKALIFSALKHINALGGSKSRGLGWIHWQNLSIPSINSQAWNDLAKGQQS